jgi:hypothetical protein
MTRPSHVTISTSLIVLVFVLGTIWFTFPQINALDSVPPHNDPMFSTWRLAWVPHQLQQDPRHLLNANIIYPSYHAFLFSDAFLLLGLFATPLIWSGLPPIVAYNILILASFVFAGLATFVFVRHLTGSTLAGVIGGVVFAFAPPRFGHYMHQELLWTGWIPLALWALHRAIETSRWRYALLTALCLAAQTYSSIYYGIFLATFLGIVSVFLILFRVLDWRSLAFRRLVVGAVLSAVLIAPYVYLYRQSERIVGLRPQWEVAQYSAQPQSYLAAPSFNWLYGWTFSKWVSERAVDETQLFPGLCAVVLAVIGLWPPLSRVKVAYAIALLLAFDWSLGFNGLTYRLLFHLPVFQGLRATARFSVFVQLALALFAGYGFARLLERALPRRAAVVGLMAVVSGVLIVEYTNRALPLARAATRPSTLSRWLQQQPPGTVLLELPLPRTDALPGLDPHYVFESTFHWRPMVNGYTAFVPPRYEHFLERMESFPNTEQSINAFRASGADLIVVHGRWLKTRGDQEGVHWLRQQPDFRFEGDFSDHAGPVMVFRRIPANGDPVASEAR